MTVAMAALAAAACTMVEGDRILASDMARAWPDFSAVAPETPLGYAPLPGARRIFAAGELARVAVRYGMREPPPAVCFERPAAPLARERALEAMRAGLGIPDARIEVVALSRHNVPPGEVVFPRQWLAVPGPAASPGVPLLWRGEVRYGASRRCAVWARVSISAPVERVCAAEEIPRGATVRAGQLRLERGEGFPLGRRDATSVEEAAGRKARRTIPAGAAVRLDLLEEPRQVEPGDVVDVVVSSGAARLVFKARAESSGGAGERVRVRNVDTRRAFTARVSGRGTVAVDVEGGCR